MSLIKFFREFFEKKILTTKEDRSKAIKCLGRHSNPNGKEQLTRVSIVVSKRIQYLKTRKA